MKPLTIAEIVGTTADATGNLVAGDLSTPFDDLSRREWLSTNGIGGFASGTVAGANTRRYHSVLVAALDPPLGRMTMLGKVEEIVAVGADRYDLATNQYENAVFPDGWRFITEFTIDPVPTWTYRLPGDTVLVKRLYLARGKNTTYITYTLRESPSMATLTITPLVCWKKYHDEMHPWEGFPTRSAQDVGGWSIQATPDSPPLRLLVRGATWTTSGWWHNAIVHSREAERGQDFLEDLYCPSVAQIGLRVGQTVTLIATTETAEPDDPTVALAEIIRRHETLLAAASPALAARGDDATIRDLVLATDPFLVEAMEVRSTILAGFPWFTDWGRDTMIALPGLCLATGRLTLARNILMAFSGYISYGMIPNRFPDQGEMPEYNTVDATLWFIHACDKYIAVSQDREFQKRIMPDIESIVAAHQAGTRYGIHVDPADGLLSAGQYGWQLTWMDAKVGEWVVTPRQGKAVEVCALWIGVLRILSRWKGITTPAGRAYADQANHSEASFREKFARPDGQGLYDVLRPDGTPDPAIRPNQVIAAALPDSPLTDEQMRAVLDVTTRELLTPVGLRSLSQSDPAYHGTYGGPQRQRDGAYHQGTVWAWLIGPYVDLYRKVNGPDADVTPLLAGLIAHLRLYGIGGTAEIFDGDAPHAPNGCPWQAWSSGELLRVYANVPAS